jgi:hypothetical protein
MEKIIMTTTFIAEQVEQNFAEAYNHFKELQQKPEYSGYWEKCMECLADRDLLMNIIFCNDVFGIPPVKTFLTVYREDYIRLTGDERAVLTPFVKRGIGAFWGMVFKFVLGYTEQRSVSVATDGYFLVRTASVYGGRPENLHLEN